MSKYKVTVELRNNKLISVVLADGNYSTVIRAMFDAKEDEVLLDTTLHDGIACPAISWLKSNREDFLSQLRSIPGFTDNHSFRFLNSEY